MLFKGFDGSDNPVSSKEDTSHIYDYHDDENGAPEYTPTS